jgi:hypothetical protein
MTTTKTRSAWAGLQARLQLFEERKREALEVDVRRRGAEREVARREAELREVYVEPDEPPERVAAAREALATAREEAEAPIWEGKLQGAQDRADQAGSEVEEYGRAHLAALVAELAAEEETSRLELGARWEQLQESVARAHALEGRLWALTRILGLRGEPGENPVAAALRAAHQADVSPRAPREWPSRVPPEWQAEDEEAIS